jgi:hypothetical protein
LVREWRGSDVGMCQVSGGIGALHKGGLISGAIKRLEVSELTAGARHAPGLDTSRAGALPKGGYTCNECAARVVPLQGRRLPAAPPGGLTNAGGACGARAARG